jgi:hypothetical protein
MGGGGPRRLVRDRLRVPLLTSAAWALQWRLRRPVAWRERGPGDLVSVLLPDPSQLGDVDGEGSGIPACSAVQRDVLGLSAEEGEELSVWAAHAVVRTALTEQETTSRLGDPQTG